MKETKRKKCKGCAYCQALYRKKLYRYYRVNGKYYCTERQTFVGLSDGCEKRRKEEAAVDVSEERLTAVQNDILFISEYAGDV